MMKKFLVLTIFSFFLSFSFEAVSQTIIVFDNTTLDPGDSTFVKWTSKKGICEWDSIYVEATFTGLAAADTTTAIEIYSTLNGDFSDATDLVTAGALIAADGAGGTGTIVKTTWVNTSTVCGHLWFVIDPAAADAGGGKVTLRFLPDYKTGYDPR